MLFWLLGSLSLARWSSVGIALLVVGAVLVALVLVWADVFARIVFDPRELPLGIVTAVVGAPLLIILVRRFHPLTT